MVVVGICLYGLFSVFYLRVAVEGVVFSLVFCAILYFITELLRSRVAPASVLCKQIAALWALILLPAFSLLGQSALSLSAMDIQGRTSIDFARNFWVVGSLWMLTGAGIAAAYLNRSNTLALVLLAILVALLWFGSDGLFVINYGRLSADVGGLRITHLTMADYAVFCLALAYGLSSGLVRVAIVLGALFVLFALGGRGALLAFAVAVFVMQVLIEKRRTSLRVALVMLLAAAFVTLQGYFEDLAQQSGAVKNLLFSQGFGRDESVIERLEQIFLGLSDLGRQAALGDLSLVVWRFDSAGAYMHNIISAWQFYGVLFFSVLVASILYSLGFANESRRWSDDSIHATFHLLLIYVVISVLVAKAITFYLLWLVIGYWLARAAASRKSGSVLGPPGQYGS